MDVFRIQNEFYESEFYFNQNRYTFYRASPYDSYIYWNSYHLLMIQKNEMYRHINETSRCIFNFKH